MADLHGVKPCQVKNPDLLGKGYAVTTPPPCSGFVDLVGISKFNPVLGIRLFLAGEGHGNHNIQLAMNVIC